jgi:hypothetical protein
MSLKLVMKSTHSSRLEYDNTEASEDFQLLLDFSMNFP